MLQRINPDGAEPLGDNYTQVVVASGTQVHVSGTLPVDGDGNVVGETMREQTEAVVENLQTSLDAAGADVSDVARARIFTLDADEYLRECHSVLLDWYDGDKPASTMVEIAGLASDEALVEIDVTAVLDE
jgi:enamine deaminase RidA (YjgF/YER057c/UK114 family)